MNRAFIVIALLLMGICGLLVRKNTTGIAKTELALQFTNQGTGMANVTWSLPPQTLGVSPTSVNFGNVVVGQVSAPITITLSTTSGIALGSPVLGGPNANEFSFTNACPAVLNINQSCSLTVKFAPQVLGPGAASLTVNFSGLAPFAPSNLHILVARLKQA